MTPEELRDQVAVAISGAPYPTKRSRDKADAAIRVVIDAAAGVVTGGYESLCTEHRLLLIDRSTRVLALKGADNDT
jgi:hypothetical protein